jgi:hypothetical protein
MYKGYEVFYKTPIEPILTKATEFNGNYYYYKMLNDEMKLFVIFCVFLLGAYVTSKHGYISDKQIEGFENDVVGSSPMLGESRCPNMLIQKGTTLFLYNTKVAAVPGVNPIRFENLEEYVEFMDWLRGNGIKCPVLFLQHSVSAQGESIYSIRPSPTEPQGGL